MCTVCGCAEGEVQIEGGHHHHDHDHHDHSHAHSHEHAHDHGHHHHDEGVVVAEGDNIHFGKGPAHAHVAGLSQSRMVQIEQDILGKNDRYAALNRAHFEQQSLFVLNLVSSPGSGKTTLLTETINRIKESRKVAVIEGDQQTANDADRIRETGVPAIQVNTGKGCHLDAHMVGHAMEKFDDMKGGLLFIENVGNLVCPAAFDLGEAHKVAILSVTEGEDKPLKYPDMFHAADLMILNKTDLLPYLDFDVERCIEYARQVNPNIQVMQLSARSGEGMDEWIEWLENRRKNMIQTRIDVLQSEIDQFQALL
ncbi:hydrogenase nickel incorporation protein HypB [Pontibacterium granulatum]|uniref:hydrogenase nickel incorporation protein HypB n=1 Tax=Pontibacterium granulatum TaxID=2036029 RepID=UPI00249A0846|nr:hydrogenase nickel incorporation protein HypB [Pontibacterium granulatum]MDI3323302.1 hydrogenase nickel incorporation protein HypB [Pontibacterium granulatum]